MTDNFGPGVSRVLDPSASSLLQVIWQQGKPPLDSELNLLQQIGAEWNRLHVLRGTPSGWYGDALNPQDSYVTSVDWSNWFRFGPQFAGERQAVMWAVVNGWVVPVTGTLTGNPPGAPNDSDTWNRIALPPPPANTGDARIDFVFLEAWLARVPPNPATTNKPASAALWRYGNVEGGFTFLPDDLQDPALGFETTQRVQLQYRVRVVSGLVGLASYPDGFDPSTVKGQGAASTPTSFIFENMRDQLGDPGLWRAGDGASNALGTVDGYSYAIPLCAVFRRNSVAWDGAPGQNLNGGLNRNPTAVDRTGYKTFSTIPVTNSVLSATGTTVTLASVANIPLPLTPATPVAIQIGDEIMLYSAISGTTMTLSSRGAFGTLAQAHPSGSTVKVLSGRPDGLYADQITKNDILDLRHTVSPGFDYQALLKANLDRLLRGRLRSTWKRSGGGPQGPFVAYQDLISAGSAPLGVTKLDNPDSRRSVFCNPVTLQPMVIPFPPPSSLTVGTNMSVSLGGSFTITISAATTVNVYSVGDSFTIPRSQFLTSLPGADSDQVTIPASQTYVKIRFQGETSDLAANQYTVSTNGSGDLVVTLSGSYAASGTRNTNRAFITFYVQYGAGRGMSRKPDAVHSVAYLSASSEILLDPQGVPTGNQPLRTAPIALWSRFRSGMFNGQLPVTSEAYVDPGSGSVVLTPFRSHTVSGPNGFTLAGYQKASPSSALSGAMPTQDLGGNPKWTTTDPLNVFRSFGYGTDPSRVINIPRKLAPGWGAVKVPILYQDAASTFDEGVNFMINAPKGASPGLAVTTYSPVVFTGGSNTFGVFSTRNLSLPSPTPATYNAGATFGGVSYAGMRFFTDSRNLDRLGLELPPFYGIARLFAVYEAQDYIDNGSSYNSSDRERNTGPGTRATNLLRSNFDGPTFWIEKDADGDSTFILNADAIDITKSPNTISGFASGHYVIECSIWGFDRGFFDLTQDARLVVTREATLSPSITSPTFVLPGAPAVGDEIAVNYSREPYSGDAWGSQLLQSDLGYTPGALSTSTRYELMTTNLTYKTLTRPNQKVLEVLAGMSFVTTLGTGRFSGNVPTNDDDFRNVGFEPWTVPATPVDARPTLTTTALVASERTLTVGSEYLGCVERLPLGALFRSKDFRGNAVGGPTGDLRQLVTGTWYGPGTMATNISPGDPEVGAAPVHPGTVSSGNGGEVVVHVDGESGNYGVLTNYRTARGGSVFSVTGFMGGDVGAVLPPSTTATTAGGILSGLALLVRNTPTDIGSNEVSAGREVMMLVVTTARTQGSSGTLNTVQCGTAGTGEGYSAADLFRIAGHPLTNDSARSVVDPSAVVLSRESDLLT